MSAFLTPEIEELMLRVARDPRARFFRADVRRRLKGRRLVDAFPTSTFSRSRAERHLLHVYREHVAGFLMELSERELHEQPGAAGEHHKSPETSRRLTHVGTTEWHESSLRKLGTSAPFLSGGEPVETLRTWIQQCPVGSTPEKSAWAALSLVPSHRARIQVARCEGRLRHWDAALPLVHDVLRSHPTPTETYRAWSFLGKAMGRRGRSREALEAYARASQSDGAGPFGAVNWFAKAVLLGDREQCRRAGARLEELSPSEPGVGPVHGDNWHRTDTTRSFLASLADSAGPATRKLCHALM